MIYVCYMNQSIYAVTVLDPLSHIDNQVFLVMQEVNLLLNITQFENLETELNSSPSQILCETNNSSVMLVNA
jgi:hypothetical protein